ncbi:MAG: F0F1 ATP synthase subunit delta [Deltaproteobacteria bacterium]|nr:F0F1 ATP synthase subunit delta [Deltaproteobacteria bacterium]
MQKKAAHRYARALFALAREEDAIASIRAELEDMARLLAANPDLRRRLFQPLHPVHERREVLKSICVQGRGSRTIQNFFAYLIEQRRLVAFEAIHDEFNRLADEAAGRVRAEVRSASPLRDEQRARLVDALARRTGKQIDLTVHVDPSLIGGAIATVGGLVFDGSLRTQLSQLHGTLAQGRSQHGND